MSAHDPSTHLKGVALLVTLCGLLCALLVFVPRVRAEARDIPAQQVGCANGATTITPCGTSVDTLMPSAIGIRPFFVHNTSATDHTYSPSCVAALPLASCTVTPSVLVVPANDSAAIAVTYVASGATAAAQTGVTVFVDGGAPDQVATTVNVLPAAESAR